MHRMGAGDRSGMSELIQMIKGSLVPIICICNDRQDPNRKQSKKLSHR
jgi:replication factor C subunit 1